MRANLYNPQRCVSALTLALLVMHCLGCSDSTSTPNTQPREPADVGSTRDIAVTSDMSETLDPPVDMNDVSDMNAPVDMSDTSDMVVNHDMVFNHDMSGALDMSGAPDMSAPVDQGEPSDMTALGDMGAPFESEPLEHCRLPYSGGLGVGVGFPKPSVRLASTGTIKAMMLFVDYPDVSAEQTPEDVFNIMSPGSEEFFSAVSYGKLNIEIQTHPTWLRLSHNAQHYGQGLSAFFTHRDFIAEAVQLADPDVDFSDTDVVIVMSTPNATAVPYGPTWMGNEGYPIIADGNAMTNGITSGADSPAWGFRWLNHEMAHSMSLPDLYSFTFNGGYTRPFGLMDWVSCAAPEYLAWERWQLDWLEDDQVLCNPVGEVELTPIETPQGRKAAFIRVSDTKILGIESRRAIGYDSALEQEGVVVTLIDAELTTGHGIIKVLNNQTPLALNQPFQYEGYSITVTGSQPEADSLEISAP